MPFTPSRWLKKLGGTLTGLLQFSGTTHAGIRLNNLTTAQRDALTPTAGMLIYNTTLSRLEVYQGGAWVDFVKLNGDTLTGLLQFSGTGHAGLKLNSLTSAQRDALTPSNGMVIYNSTTNKVQKYEGGAWSDIAGAVTSVFGRTGAVTATPGDYNAGQVTNTPSGGIAATTVQAAINELDAEKANTGANVGSGVGIFKDKTDVTLNFKTLVNGQGVSAAASGANEILLSCPYNYREYYASPISPQVGANIEGFALGNNAQTLGPGFSIGLQAKVEIASNGFAIGPNATVNASNVTASPGWCAAIGKGAQANIDGSLALGLNANPSVFFQTAFTSHPASGERPALTTLIGTTTNATPKKLTAHEIAGPVYYYFTLKSGACGAFTILVTGRRDTNAEFGAWRFDVATRHGGTLESAQMLGTAQKNVLGKTTEAWDVNVSVIGSGSTDQEDDTLQVEVTGEAGKTITWAALITSIEQ
jgi:hypothetical protein